MWRSGLNCWVWCEHRTTIDSWLEIYLSVTTRNRLALIAEHLNSTSTLLYNLFRLTYLLKSWVRVTTEISGCRDKSNRYCWCSGDICVSWKPLSAVWMDSLLESVWLRRRRHLDTDCLAAMWNKKIILVRCSVIACYQEIFVANCLTPNQNKIIYWISH